MPQTADERRARSREYYRRNREAILAKAAQARKENPEKERERVRNAVAAHYPKNREAILAAKKARYASDPAMRERMRAAASARRIKMKAEKAGAA